ncbi:MAG: NAD(P)-binding protein [Acidobacteriota bacterium]
MKTITTDYLIVGAGAVGMAFADVLLSETEHEMVIVDRHAKPGGHWNIAYPFVTLHQPSAFYGVSSHELSKGRIDPAGPNKGLHELASGTEVSAYFDDVMRHHFQPSGRVEYFPMCLAEPLEDKTGGEEVVCQPILGGEPFRVKARKRVVDATYLKTTVPANHKPSFTVEDGVRFALVNDLPRLKEAPEGYVVIGGGKTGIDACLWLLQNGADPDQIRWVMPRDGWMLDRQNAQPGDSFFEHTIGALARQMEAIAESTSRADLFDRLEAAGLLLRLDKDVRPKMFHAATVSRAELDQLRQIRQVIRMGRIETLGPNEIVFEQGTLPTSPRQLHVDCSASAVGNLEMTQVFDEHLIVPQTVRAFQPVFSAAFVAHVEATFDDDATKNRLCAVVPLPNHHTDWIRVQAAQMINQAQWSQDPGLRQWLYENRLDGISRMVRDAPKDDEAKQQILAKMREHSMPAMQKLLGYVAELANEG